MPWLVLLALAGGTSAAAQAPAADRLPAILAGGEPATVDELRAMQSHLQDLLPRVLPAVVSLDGASGVLVRHDGVTCVVSAAHVTQEPGRRLRIRMHDGGWLRGRTLGCDHVHDIALIRVESEDAEALPALELGSSKDLRRGQWVVMLGHPSGRKPGRAAPARLGRVLRPSRHGFVLTDCTMQAGDSGGPLLDAAGRVIGINSRITGNLAENMHAPADALREQWSDLLAGKVVEDPSARRGFGIALLPASSGLRAPTVPAASRAFAAGLRSGDILVSVDGRAVGSPRDLARVLMRHGGDLVPVVVLRGSQRLELSLPVLEGGQ